MSLATGNGNPSPRPTCAEPQISSIPQELKEHPQWVLWTYEKRHGKWTKPLLDPCSDRYAKTDNPHTWGTFNDVTNSPFKADGIGFVFTHADPYVGIDLDDCISEDGKLEDWAEEILSKFGTYAEVSPSGRGVKLICKGSIPSALKTDQIEIYETLRYFTVTGHHVPVLGLPSINECQEQIDWLHAKTKPPAPVTNQATIPAPLPIQMDDRELVERITRSGSGAKFQELYNGVYGSDHSKADMQLCCMLAWWTQGCKDQIDRIFRQSGLFQNDGRAAKWDKVHHSSGNTYGQETIERAIAFCGGNFYDPNRNNSNSQEATPDVDTVERGVNRLEIMTSNKQLSELSTEILHALRVNADQLGTYKVFQRNKKLVRVMEDTATGGSYLEDVSVEAMIAIMSRVCAWLKNSKEGPVSCIVPKAIISPFVASARFPGVKVIEGVRSFPFVSSSGKLVYEEGYYEEDRTVLKLSKRFTIPTVPEMPTDEEVDASTEKLFDLVCDFPFKSESDRCNWLACLLLPFVREYIYEPTPMHVFEAPSYGTGKTMLASLIHWIVEGVDPAVMTASEQDDEMRKRLTSILAESKSSFAFVDNVNSLRQLSSLAAMTTNVRWSDRWLGQNRILSFRNNLVWMITANNLLIDYEQARRAISIRQDAVCENPEERSEFKYPHIRSHVFRNRPEYMQACLIIIQRWIAEGKPTGDKSKGSFERWAKVMSGILSVCGKSGDFMANPMEVHDPEQDELCEFIFAWFDKYGEDLVGLNELYNLAEPPMEKDPDSIGETRFIRSTQPRYLDSVIEDKRERAAKTAMGMYMSKLKGRVFKSDSGGKLIRLNVEKRKHRVAKYRLEQL